MGNLFYKDTSAQGATVGVQLAGNSAWNVISNNVSYLPASPAYQVQLCMATSQSLTSLR